jgi:membrane protease YdiL (CAAX protease family)
MMLKASGGEFNASVFLIPATVAIWGVFMLIPLAATWYLKLEFKNTFQWRMPGFGAVAGAVLLGCGSFLIVQELVSWQSYFWPTVELAPLSEAIQKFSLRWWGPPVLVLVMGFTPGICEEHFFRGFLQQGLTGKDKWKVFLTVGLIFGVFHCSLFKLPVLTMMGVALAYVAYETRSIWPGVIFHFLHNSLTLTVIGKFTSQESNNSEPSIPIQWLIPAVIMFVIGLLLVRRPRAPAPEPSLDSIATASGS